MKLFFLIKGVNKINVNASKKDNSNNKNKNIIMKLENKVKKA